MCEVPFASAPELFGTVQDPKGYPHCYVKRQPATQAELDGMLMAVKCAELECIRYRGSDRLIQLELVQADLGIVCDGLPADLQAEADRCEVERQRRWLEHLRSQHALGDTRPTPPRPSGGSGSTQDAKPF